MSCSIVVNLCTIFPFLQESPYLFTNLNSSPEKFFSQGGEIDNEVHANAANFPNDIMIRVIAATQQQSATPTSVIVVSVLGGTLVALLAVIVGIAYVRRRKATVSETALLLDN